MVLGYYGRWVPLEELRHATAVNRDGTKASNIVKAAQLYGLQARGFSRKPEDLAQLPMPAIVFWNFNHFITVEGVDGNKLYINDPATGPRTMTMQEFDEGFTGVALAFEPTAEFERGGVKPSILANIAGCLNGTWGGIATCVLAGFLLLLPGLLIPGVQRAFTDFVLVAKYQSWLWWVIAALAGIAVVKATLTFLQQYLMARLQLRLGVSSNGRLLWHILHLPTQYFAQRNAGEIANRAGTADRFTGLLSGSVGFAIVNILTIAVYGLVMLAYDVKLTAIVVSFALVNLLLLIWMVRKLSDLHRRTLQDDARLQGMLVQGLSNLDNYRASGTEDLFFRRWAGAQTKLVTAEQRMQHAQKLVANAPTFLSTAAGIALVLLGGFSVMEGAISIGMLVAFQTLMGSFMAPVGSFVMLGAQLQQTRGYADRMGDVYRQPADPMLTEGRETQKLQAFAGALEVKNASFGYSPVTPPQVTEVSVTVAPGARVGIVGGSGSGKSTLARLMVGLTVPQKGEVLLDGTPMSKIDNDVLRTAVGYVDQTTMLMSGSIKDNLTLWDTTIPEERMVAAAKDAAIHDIVASRPGAYEAKLTENGGNLSGGERQRLTIARALTCDRSVVVLDEAMSALDAISEQQIIDNIRRRGCTCIVVAHRVSAVRDCDEILVMHHGRIAERGRHDDLVQKQGLYAKLVADA